MNYSYPIRREYGELEPVVVKQKARSIIKAQT